MTSIRLTVQELNDILAGKILDRTGGPSLKIHSHVGKKRNPDVPGKISDGYHTFDELYEHRIVLWIALCRVWATSVQVVKYVWRSKKHSDGSKIDGWFLLGMGDENGEQITYHLPMRFWKATNFCKQNTLPKAPEFDGHTSADVLDRISKL